MLSQLLLRCRFGAEPRPFRDPAPDGSNLCVAEGVLLAGRHHAAVHLLEERTVVGFSGDDGRARLAALEDASGSAQVQVRLARLVAVTAQAFRLEQRSDVALVGRCRVALALTS